MRRPDSRFCAWRGGGETAAGRHPEAARIELEAVEPAEQGQLAEADDLFRRTLDLDLRALGDGHPATAVACSDVAQVNAATLARHEAALALDPARVDALLRDCRRFIVPG